MTASLHVKKGMYYIVLSFYDENNKRSQKWISTHLPEKGNKRAAINRMNEVLSQYNDLELSKSKVISFSNYVLLWLRYAKKHVDPVTYHGYESIAKLHVIPYFSNLDISINNVTLQVLQEFFDFKATSGRTDGTGGLSPRSLQLIRNVVSQTFVFAQKNGDVGNNPCQLLRLPKKQKHLVSFFTADQLQLLFSSIQNESLFPLIKVTALYGLRRSEVLGLKWDCVDFVHNVFVIKSTVCQAGSVFEKDTTKNSSSYRVLPLSSDTKDLFLKLKTSENYNRSLFGSSYFVNDYIFKWPDGHLYQPDYISKSFSKILNKYGFPHIRFHDLRHSCASLLISNGYNLKDVQDWLGHSDINMTANLYGHLDLKRKIDLANSISSSFSFPS